MKDIALDRRDEEVLEAVISAYVETGEPVGSRTIARLSKEGLSAATIRNVMADLEEKKLLSQPHSSAGRVPTDLGYRIFVDSLMKRRRLPAADEKLIEASLAGVPAEPSELFTSASRILSRLSRHLGVVVTPHIARVRLRDIEFVRVAPHRVLVIVVAAAGSIHNRVVEIPQDHDQHQLDQIGRYLTSEFSGHTLSEIRDRILDMMGQEKALYDTLLRDALELGKASFDPGAGVEAGQGGEVIVEGRANLLADPEFATVERMRSLFRTFEEKHELVRMLNSCLEEQELGVRVRIGSENQSPDLSDCTLITSTYGDGDRMLGTLGILGPTRMEYARAIALVDSVARFFSHTLSRIQG